MFAFMDAPLKNVCTASLGITYTACSKHTAALRYGFKLAPFKFTPTPPLNILTLPNWLTV
jgi:hypothetical protein